MNHGRNIIKVRVGGGPICQSLEEGRKVSRWMNCICNTHASDAICVSFQVRS